MGFRNADNVLTCVKDVKNIITAGYQAMIHVHTASEEVSLTALLNYFDRKTGEWAIAPESSTRPRHATWCPGTFHDSDPRYHAQAASPASHLNSLRRVRAVIGSSRKARKAPKRPGWRFATFSWNPPPTLLSCLAGMKVIALVEASSALCVETFASTPQLGRFTLRDEGKTVAIGKITKLIEVRSSAPCASGRAA